MLIANFVFEIIADLIIMKVLLHLLLQNNTREALRGAPFQYEEEEDFSGELVMGVLFSCYLHHLLICFPIYLHLFDKRASHFSK